MSNPVNQAISHPILTQLSEENNGQGSESRLDDTIRQVFQNNREEAENSELVADNEEWTLESLLTENPTLLPFFNLGSLLPLRLTCKTLNTVISKHIEDTLPKNFKEDFEWFKNDCGFENLDEVVSFLQTFLGVDSFPESEGSIRELITEKIKARFEFEFEPLLFSDSFISEFIKTYNKNRKESDGDYPSIERLHFLVQPGFAVNVVDFYPEQIKKAEQLANDKSKHVFMLTLHLVYNEDHLRRDIQPFPNSPEPSFENTNVRIANIGRHFKGGLEFDFGRNREVFETLLKLNEPLDVSKEMLG